MSTPQVRTQSPHTIRRALERWVGIAAAAGALAFGAKHALDSPPPNHDASLWQLLFADPMTLDIVRVAFALLALFAIASMAALLVSGRWLRAGGGFEVDDRYETQALGSDKTQLQADVRSLREGLAAVLTMVSRGGMTDEPTDDRGAQR